MKVFVPTMCKVDRLRTHLWLMNTGADYTFVVHEVGDSFTLASLGIPMDRIVICDPPNIGVATIGWIRSWIERELVGDHEWYVMLDDDILVSKLPDPYWTMNSTIDPQAPEFAAVDLRSAYETPMHVKDFLPMVWEIKCKCEANGTILGGITWNDNYFFRLAKWKTKAFVCGGFTVTQQNDHCPWVPDPRVVIAEDTARSVLVMERFGKVVLNQYATIAPLGSQENSSIGPLAHRRSAWEHTRDYLCQTYSRLVTSKVKKNGDVQLVWRSDKSIREYREARGFVRRT